MEKEPIFKPENKLETKDSLQHLKEELIQEAIDKYGKIFPAGSKKNLDDCFTIDDIDENDHELGFWFNTEDNNTHLLSKKIPRE